MNEIRISAEQFRRELTELLSQAGYGGASVIIERHGTPLAALIPYQEYQKQMAEVEQSVLEADPSEGATVLREAAAIYDARPPRTTSPVLTLDEAAAYLRTSADLVKQQAESGKIPGRKLGDAWRFSHTALDHWLEPHSSRDVLLAQAGIFANDRSLDEMIATIYQQRGRPEGESADGPEKVS